VSGLLHKWNIVDYTDMISELWLISVDVPFGDLAAQVAGRFPWGKGQDFEKESLKKYFVNSSLHVKENSSVKYVAKSCENDLR